jgi:hypothetical protein
LSATPVRSTDVEPAGDQARSGELGPQLPERPVDPRLDGRQRLADELRDLRHRQVGAEAEGDDEPLVGREDLETPAENVTVVDLVAARVVRLVARRQASRERPLLGRAPPGVVTQAVQRDRVEPRLLAPSPRIEQALCREDALERIAEQILRQRVVTGAVVEKREQRPGVGRVESLEVLVSQV